VYFRLCLCKISPTAMLFGRRLVGFHPVVLNPNKRAGLVQQGFLVGKNPTLSLRNTAEGGSLSILHPGTGARRDVERRVGILLLCVAGETGV
jgi:hypothetical protein